MHGSSTSEISQVVAIHSVPGDLERWQKPCGSSGAPTHQLAAYSANSPRTPSTRRVLRDVNSSVVRSQLSWGRLSRFGKELEMTLKPHCLGRRVPVMVLLTLLSASAALGGFRHVFPIASAHDIASAHNADMGMANAAQNVSFRPPHLGAHPIPSIDGAVRPDLIPADVAYGIFLGSLKAPNRPAAQLTRNALARRAFAGSDCGSALDGKVDSWVSTLIAHADAYHAGLSQLDKTPDAGAGRAERELLARDVIVSLHVAIGSEASQLLDCYVTRVVRSKIRYFVSR